MYNIFCECEPGFIAFVPMGVTDVAVKHCVLAQQHLQCKLKRRHQVCREESKQIILSLLRVFNIFYCQ